MDLHLARTDVDQAKPTPAQRVPKDATGLQPILGLQRWAGNRAVANAIAPAIVAQRDDGAARPPAPALAGTALARAEHIRASTTARLANIAVYNGTADAAIGSYREKRTTFATRWGAAWDRHSTKLAEGNEAAASQNLVEGIVIGTLAAVLISAGAAAVFPAAAAASMTTGAFWAFNIGSNAASSVVGGLTASAVGRPSVPGPTAGRRDAEAEGWQRVAAAEQAARAVAATAPKFGLELGNAEYCIAQVQAHIDGRGGDMTWDETLNMVSTLANWELSVASFDAEITAKTTAMASFGQAAQDFQVPSVDDTEKHIWRGWMSTLDDSSDEALDQDVIQRHLVRLGLIPDHVYMTNEDQHRAVATARAQIAAPTP
ncbi:hypothetical protein [Agromyces sp. Marseille-Q5079]|uniref:hypothetical protein n=1 Tax=Agromyces sp. Marseille-Q5079 TaxID=3439059 RepID=UPI003D9C7DA1